MLKFNEEEILRKIIEDKKLKESPRNSKRKPKINDIQSLLNIFVDRPIK